MQEDSHEARDGTLSLAMSDGESSCYLALSGELDLANAGTLEAHLKRAESDGNEVVTVDLTELAFIDSTGIAVLVAAHHRLAGRGCRLELVPSKATEVKRVLSITGLDTELSFTADPDGAPG
jgi:anti-sigma B factor antagonist